MFVDSNIYSLFLDANELYSSKGYVLVPTVSLRLPQVNIVFYVSLLTVEECAVHLFEDFKKFNLEMTKFQRLVSLTDTKVDVQHFREQILSQLKTVPNLRLFDLVPHEIEYQKILFEARHKGAYKDTIVFASSVAYAKAASLRNCYFLTKDKNDKSF